MKASTLNDNTGRVLEYEPSKPRQYWVDPIPTEFSSLFVLLGLAAFAGGSYWVLRDDPGWLNVTLRLVLIASVLVALGYLNGSLLAPAIAFLAAGILALPMACDLLITVDVPGTFFEAAIVSIVSTATASVCIVVCEGIRMRLAILVVALAAAVTSWLACMIAIFVAMAVGPKAHFVTVVIPLLVLYGVLGALRRGYFCRKSMSK